MSDTRDDEIVNIEVCPECRRHARFICGDEEVSDEFFSQLQAEELALEYRQTGMLSEEELEALREKIRQSGLPMTISDEMQYLLNFDDDLAGFESTFSNPSDGEFMDNLHDFLQKFFPETPMTLQ